LSHAPCLHESSFWCALEFNLLVFY
jgi:hypothetical protein